MHLWKEVTAPLWLAEHSSSLIKTQVVSIMDSKWELSCADQTWIINPQAKHKARSKVLFMPLQFKDFGLGVSSIKLCPSLAIKYAKYLHYSSPSVWNGFDIKITSCNAATLKKMHWRCVSTQVASNNTHCGPAESYHVSAKGKRLTANVFLQNIPKEWN